MKRARIVLAAAVAALVATSAAYAQERGVFVAANTTIPTPVSLTNVTGTIAQLNYDANGSVNGFLIGTTTLLTFATNVCGGLGTLGAVGNSVTYSGTQISLSSGFQTVTVSSFTNNTTKAAYTRALPKASTFGPTPGTVKQLNYDGQGNIDGFLFAATGTTTPIFVSTGTRASTTLKPLLTLNGPATVTGTTSTSLAACSAASELEAVDATALTLGGQTIVIVGGGPSIFGIPIGRF